MLWFLPTHGDGRYLGTATGGRATDLPYLSQIAQAADQLGYYGVLLPTGKELRGFLDRRLGDADLDRAAALPGRGAGRGCSRRRSPRA